VAKRKKGVMQKQNTPHKGANFNDVLIKLVDAIYNLVNSGNIAGVILLFLCYQTWYITSKLSADSLDKFITNIFSLKFYYLIPLVVALSISVSINFFQRAIYKRRINDLIQTRKELIHGLQSSELQVLKRHNPCGIDSMETENDC
jgi:hypothetical protein